MKRIACFALALCITAGLMGGCGNKEDKKENSSSPVSSAVTVSKAPVSQAPVQMAKAVKIKATDGLNIRIAPSSEGEIIGLAEDGSKLPLLVSTPNDGWYEVEYEGESAYVSANYVEVVDVTLEEYNKLKTSGGSAETSSAPESSSSVSSSPASSSPASAVSKSPASSEPVSGTSDSSTEDGE